MKQAEGKRISIHSFSELQEHESEILRRIANVPHGAKLFMLHPFMLLADIGVVLSEEAKGEMIHRAPALSGLSPTPYRALKRSRDRQHVAFELRSLFQK